MKKRGVVLLSGGLDSAVTLFFAVDKGYDCRCVTFDYGQRNKAEITGALRLAKASGAGIEVVKLSLPWKGSSLLDGRLGMPAGRTPAEIRMSGVPSTYVPARNTIFLSMAASYAEATGARRIFIGAHSDDSSGYPDCRKDYLDAFNKAIKLGTRMGREGRLALDFPMIEKNKADIIRMGIRLGVPFEFTRSCYKSGRMPCMECDSCVLRAKGFREAGISDPALIR